LLLCNKNSIITLF